MSYYIVKKTYNKKRIIITCACVISVILFMSVFIFHIVQAKKHNAIALQYENQVNEINQEEQENLEKQKQLEQAQKLAKLPQYNEQIKNKVDNIYKSEEKTAYLTFDDGPSKKVTTSILDTLKKENVKATFFVLGSRVDLYPELVKREYEEGHFIANHGYSHNYSSIYKSPKDVLVEYQKTNNAVKKAIGVPEYESHLFRFPGGSSGGKYHKVKQKAIELLEKNKIAHVNWNALTEDSVGKPSKKKMMKTLKQTIGDKNVVVILMHDAGNKQKTAQMLPDVIKYLKEKGYNFKNFYEVMK